MTKAEQAFKSITEDLMDRAPGVSIGKMMSAPGLKFNNKVFVFIFQNEMVFRLGRDFDPESMGIIHYTYLNPFKHKGPMKDRFVIPATEITQWPKLANIALQKMQKTSIKNNPKS